MNIGNIAALPLLMLALSCTAKGQTEDATAAFSKYISAWKSRDIGTVWKMTSSRLRQGNGNDEKQFQAYAEKQGFRPYAFHLIRAERRDAAAEIVADITYVDDRNANLGSETQYCRMVLEAKHWLFDDCKAAAEK